MSWVLYTDDQSAIRDLCFSLRFDSYEVHHDSELKDLVDATDNACFDFLNIMDKSVPLCDCYNPRDGKCIRCQMRRKAKSIRLP